MQTVKDEAEARKRGFPNGDTFKLLQQDIILVPESQAAKAFEERARAGNGGSNESDEMAEY